MAANLFNPVLLQVARQTVKAAFVDPSTASGGQVGPTTDPMAGAMPAMPGMAPGGGGEGGDGGPPPDPSAAMDAGGGGGGPSREEIQAMIQSAMSQGGGAGGMGGVEPIKPKIDVNVEIMQMKRLLARICDALKIDVPASEMAITSGDLTQMAMQQGNQGGGAGGGAGGAAGGAGSSAISPISPIQGAAPALAGGAGGGGGGEGQFKKSSVDLVGMQDRAAALAVILRRK